LQSEDAIGSLFSELDFGLGDNSWIADDPHIFRTLHFRYIYKCMQCILAHLAFQADLDFELVRLADSKSCRICREINTGDWWGDTQDGFTARVMIMPVICASDKTDMTNFVGD